MPGGRTIRTPEKQAQILQLIRASGGCISRVLKAIKLPKRTFYDWLQADPEFAARVEDAVHSHEARLVLEDALREIAFTDKNVTALIFLMKGHDPRYREHVELSGKLSMEALRGAFLKLPTDERERMIRNAKAKEGGRNAGGND